MICKWLTRSTAAFLLAASLTFSTGCKTYDPPHYDWVKPITFSAETKAWLRSLEWPESAYADFDQIVKHNEKVSTLRGEPNH